MNCIGHVLDGDQDVGDIGRYSRPTQIISVHKRNFRSGGDGSNPNQNQKVFWYWLRSHEWGYSNVTVTSLVSKSPLSLRLLHCQPCGRAAQELAEQRELRAGRRPLPAPLRTDLSEAGAPPLHASRTPSPPAWGTARAKLGPTVTVVPALFQVLMTLCFSVVLILLMFSKVCQLDRSFLLALQRDRGSYTHGIDGFEPILSLQETLLGDKAGTGHAQLAVEHSPRGTGAPSS
jgi:hypothetical protein